MSRSLGLGKKMAADRLDFRVFCLFVILAASLCFYICVLLVQYDESEFGGPKSPSFLQWIKPNSDDTLMEFNDSSNGKIRGSPFIGDDEDLIRYDDSNENDVASDDEVDTTDDLGDLDYVGQMSDSVGPNASELELWWRKGLTKEDLGGHIEAEYFPVNLKNHSLPDARFTRAWRRDCLMKLLKSFADLCKRLGVAFWLDAGSLLGRMRSNGASLIPWDSDVDVGMLREEFTKFDKAINETLQKGLGLGLSDGIKINFYRGSVLPGRIIDMHSGFYIDIFDFYTRTDGNIQFLWPFSGTHACGQPSKVGLACELPCKDNKWCYIFRKEDVLPVVRCNLSGAGDALYCPHDEERYLRTQYSSCCNPDRFWSSEEQDFVT